MSDLVIGILAIQGAVEEHAQLIKSSGAKAILIRKVDDFQGVDGIILPGGESTTMAIVGEQSGLFPVLKTWVAEHKPIWGTCAGMILLSNHAIKQAEGGQSLVGGLDVEVCRNYFGSQIHSCQIEIDTPALLNDTTHEGGGTTLSERTTAVFIRAPAILKVGPGVEVLARIVAAPHRSARDEVVRILGTATDVETKVETNADPDHGIDGTTAAAKVIGVAVEKFDVVIAAKQGNILATAFHPELTEDLRWHKYFLRLVQGHKEASASSSSDLSSV